MDNCSRLNRDLALAVLAALLAVHAGDAIRPLVLAVIAWLVLCSLRDPASGLLAALPLVYMISPTPTAIGWREAGFAAVVTVASFASLWHRRLALAALPRWGCGWMLIAAGWLGVNFTTALWNGVAVSDWLRGVAPFIFIFYLLPVWLEAKGSVEFARAWRYAAGITAALFAGHVVQVYLGGQLWKPATFVFEGGAWVPMGPEEARALGKQVFEFAIRVTQRLQQATDTLLCLGVVWGAWAALWLKNVFSRVLGLTLSMLATVAIVLTYTRSMLLASLLVVLGLILAALWRGWISRVVVLVFALFLTTSGSIIGFSLEAIYLNRIVQMREQASASLVETRGEVTPMPSADSSRSPVYVSAPPASPDASMSASEKQPKDANIASRLDEYRIAWDMFRSSPLLGHGLGVQHAIRFDAGNGESIDARVGYIHNWVMYVLMTGGLLGLGAYVVVLFGPAISAWRRCSPESGLRELTLATVTVMAIYGLFFAVFRLIPFNLVLGGVWGLVLAAQPTRTRG